MGWNRREIVPKTAEKRAEEERERVENERMAALKKKAVELEPEDKNFKALFPGGRGVEIRAGGGKKDQNGGIRNFRLHKRPYRTPQG